MARRKPHSTGAWSRRQLLLSGAAAGAAAITGGVTVAGQGGRGAAAPVAVPPQGGRPNTDGDVALVNGTFVDGRGVVASALTIKNGRIANLGQAALGPDARVVNLGGRTVVPGFCDSHVHYTRAGVNPGYEARRIERAFSISEMQEAIALRATAVPAGAFITCIGGWNHLQFAEARRPTKAELDAAAPRHAVYISGTGGGTGAITNTLGSAFFSARGVPVDATTGVVGSADLALAALQAAQTAADKLRGTADLNAHASSLGLTLVKNSGNFADLEYPLQLWRQGALTVRMRPTFPPGSVDEVVARLANTFSMGNRPHGDPLFTVPGFGERVGGNDTMSANFEPTARAIAQGHWLLEQHSLTLGENDFHLAALQRIAQQYPIDGLRWALIHVNAIQSSHLAALAALGAGVLPHGSSRYLGTMTNAGPPYRLIVDSGIPAGAGTDATNVAPLDPWLALFYMTTGRNLAGTVINPGQQISRVEALRLYTEGTAYFTFDEHDLGSFSVGKFADLAVLNEDYLTVPESRIRKIESVLTMVGGKVVHASAPFANLKV